VAQRNLVETVAGAIVLVVAIGFLGYAVANTGRTPVTGYSLHARFDHIDGLAMGSDVRIAGVKVGSVMSARVDPQTYQADVTFTVQNAVKLPSDSSAEVTSDGLLGGKYLSLVPGGDEQMLPAGGTVTITQGSVSLEQLLGKFIFSVTSLASQKPQGQGSGQELGAPK
jgi:phospholipid/cholesterol/gamma-HCH transport system substrate-binding protein